VIFKTLNSTYEIDDDAPRVRRLAGVNETLIGPDGEWREFVEAFTPGEGARANFYLTDGLVLSTSMVTEWDTNNKENDSE
jgi:hypothetical protein